MKLTLKTVQPHSGAIIMALYHYLKFPGMPNFDIRMTEPYPKVYRVTMEATTRDTIVFRTGKDWPCYSKIYLAAEATQFRLRHDHSGVEDEFRIYGNRLQMGRVRTEAGLEVRFEGDFYHPKMLEFREEYRLDHQLYAPRRYYEVDNVW